VTEASQPVSRDPVYNPLDEDVLKDPYPVFARMRREQPIYWHEQMKSWVLTRYDDCKTVLRSHEVWARDRRRVGAEISDEYINMQSMDPPEVLPLRSGFVNAFKTFDFEGASESARATTEKHLRQLPKGREVCLMSDFALPVAEKITCDVFGLNHPGERVFHDIAHGIALQMDSGLMPSQRWEGRKVAPQLREVIAQGFALRRPGGLFDAVARTFEAGDWPKRMIEYSMEAMVNAAYSTVYTSIGNAALALLKHPHALEQFNADNLVSGTDELLRYDSPAQGTSRTATKATRVGDKEFQHGDVVITMFSAANRDPAQFVQPDEIQLDRSPNQHLGFGWGVHSCLGTELARRVLQQFVATLVGDSRRFELRGEPVRFRTATLRWLKSLPVSG
jgi:cytochrome P450